MNTSHRLWYIYAVVGLILFVVVLLLQPLVYLPSIAGIGYTILFAPFVIVPLALSFICFDHKHLLHRLLLVLHLPAAISCAISLCIETSILSAVLAIPWFIQNILIAFYGLLFFTHHYKQKLGKQLPTIAITMGCLYIPIAGAWLIFSNLGVTFGFRATIVLLTAAHFHYAGFALSILVGISTNAFPQMPMKNNGWLVVFCPILVAVGITFSPIIEMISATVLAISIIIFSATVAFTFRQKLIVSRLCFFFAFLAMVVTMVLASLYACSEYFSWDIISISTMAKTHGVANAFGFTLLSLLGWFAYFRDTTNTKI